LSLKGDEEKKLIAAQDRITTKAPPSQSLKT
jgi:hypothetical protein